MGPVVHVVSTGAVLATACAALVCLGLVGAVLWRRSARRRQETLNAALVRSQDEIESLSRRVEELSDEVGRARRTADQDREYVITSLGSEEKTGSALAPAEGQPLRRPVTRVVEDQLVGALARQPRSMVRTRAVDLVVRAVALGHGVRQALSADVLDRAAAEAHVARRRSRRERRRVVRQARRVRADRAADQDVA